VVDWSIAKTVLLCDSRNQRQPTTTNVTVTAIANIVIGLNYVIKKSLQKLSTRLTVLKTKGLQKARLSPKAIGGG
jgi:hypothetical protein